MTFTEDIIKALTDKKKITEGSIKVYIRNLQKLNGGEIENFNFLTDIPAIMSKLTEYKETTKRNYLISIVSILSVFPEQKELHDKYYDLMMDAKKTVDTENEKGEMTETQEKNWMSLEDVNQKFKDLESQVQTFYKKKAISDDEYTDLLGYTLLSLYVLQEQEILMIERVSLNYIVKNS